MSYKPGDFAAPKECKCMAAKVSGLPIIVLFWWGSDLREFYRNVISLRFPSLYKYDLTCRLLVENSSPIQLLEEQWLLMISSSKSNSQECVTQVRVGGDPHSAYLTTFLLYLFYFWIWMLDFAHIFSFLLCNPNCSHLCSFGSYNSSNARYSSSERGMGPRYFSNGTRSRNCWYNCWRGPKRY